MKKIIIIGRTASGKTTLANKLGKLLGIPVYHLDKIFWKDNGDHLHQAEFIEKVNEIMEKPSWIIDGDNPRSKTLDMRIMNADTIILYDLPLLFILWRQTKRFFKYYNRVRPDMGGNNKQKYPFTWKEIKHALEHPTKEIYAKILPHKNNKIVFIIKSSRDEISFFQKVNHLVDSRS